MTEYTQEVLEDFDFTEALPYSESERIGKAIDKIRKHIDQQGTQEFFDLPLIPKKGASEEEIAEEEKVNSVKFPEEYRMFLKTYRYIAIDDGLKIWGFDHEGITYGSPWLSDEHKKGKKYLVFGDFWMYADGDQLMFDMDNPNNPVIVYLHEHGPLFEYFAPSFSLALWRIANEFLFSDEEEM